MNVPRMVLFDYGNTIITEKIFGFDKGNEALLKMATKNPRNITITELQAKANEVFDNLPKKMGVKDRYHQSLEISWSSASRYVFEYFGIEFDKPYEELEWIYWNHATCARPSENIEELLDFLHDNGIMTGVISNIMMSGNSLKRRINEILPNHHFAFVIASSDYLYRKPAFEIFELALIKSGLKANEVWFCGDNPICDIEGASLAGLQPIWYRKTYEEKPNLKMTLPSEKYMAIDDWAELKEIIRGVKK